MTVTLLQMTHSRHDERRPRVGTGGSAASVAGRSNRPWGFAGYGRNAGLGMAVCHAGFFTHARLWVFA